MSHRLPETVVPTLYDLHLRPDLDAATFAGTAAIDVDVREPVAEVLLNAAELEIDSVAAERDGRILVGTAVLVTAEERARLVFPEPLTPGPWRLRLGFRGLLNDKLHGFYRSSWRDEAGNVHAMATTQFESTDARRAFPCWDEPAAKAVFRVALTVPAGLAAVSNARVLAETPDEPGWKTVRFADTMKMSTYLVAFIVGELEATEPVFVGKTPIRVWHVPGRGPLAKYGLEVAAFSLKWFEDYYGIPYPGDKLDLLAIPDFASGAMENLGAVTFRQTALLLDADRCSHAERVRVADVVAHELAHMWFGDLVTMKWWEGIWLNEAFATYLEMAAVDAFRPAWGRWNEFALSRAAAMSVDGLRNTRAVEFPVGAPRECEAMFDTLTYEKGGSVLRMLEQHLGVETFREGVRRYLQRHAYANADTQDLWNAIAEASGQDIPAMMHEWIFQPGFPVVTIEPSAGGLRLTQRRFSPLPGDGAGERPWKVPVALRITRGGRDTVQHVLLDGPETFVPVPMTPERVVGNAGGAGFYRVAYGGGLLERLADGLAHLLPVERFNLLNDAFALTQAGTMPVASYLELTARFRDEDDRAVWGVLVGSLGWISRTLDESERPKLEALVRDRVGPAVDRLGWDAKPGEPDVTRSLRGDLLRAIGVLGNDPATQAEARRRFAAVRGGQAGDPDVLAACVGIIARSGDVREYEDFRSLWRGAKTPQEEQRYLYALAAFRDPTLVARTLDGTLDGTFRTQDAPYVVRSMMFGTASRRAAWAFLQQHWDAMEKAWPHNALRRMCEGVTGLVDAPLEREVQAFFATRAGDMGGKTLDQYLEQLRIAVAFRERQGGRL